MIFAVMTGIIPAYSFRNSPNAHSLHSRRSKRIARYIFMSAFTGHKMLPPGNRFYAWQLHTKTPPPHIFFSVCVGFFFVWQGYGWLKVLLKICWLLTATTTRTPQPPGQLLPPKSTFSSSWLLVLILLRRPLSASTFLVTFIAFRLHSLQAPNTHPLIHLHLHPKPPNPPNPPTKQPPRDLGFNFISLPLRFRLLIASKSGGP